MSTEEDKLEEENQKPVKDEKEIEKTEGENEKPRKIKAPEKHVKWVEGSHQDAEGVERTIRVPLPYKPKGEMFAIADAFQGGSRFK